MEGTYFEIMPKELLYKITLKLSYGDVYQIIRLFDLDYDATFRLLSIQILPFLEAYKLHESFRGRRISWSNIYDDIMEKVIVLLDMGTSLLSLSRHGGFHQMKDLVILLLREYVNLISNDIPTLKDDKLLVYEHKIRDIWSKRCSMSMSMNEDRFLASFEDIIKIASHNYEVRLIFYVKRNEIGGIGIPRDVDIIIRNEIIVYRKNNYVIALSFSTMDHLNVIGIMDNGHIRYMSSLEIRVAIACGFKLGYDAKLLSYQK